MIENLLEHAPLILYLIGNSFSSSGSLQIAKALESDYGRYECVASNEYGVAYSFAAMLYVRGVYLQVAIEKEEKTKTTQVTVITFSHPYKSHLLENMDFELFNKWLTRLEKQMINMLRETKKCGTPFEMSW